MVADPKNFLKALLAPNYTIIEGERAPKKRNFFPIFSKSAFFSLFIQNYAGGEEILAKTGTF